MSIAHEVLGEGRNMTGRTFLHGQKWKSRFQSDDVRFMKNSDVHTRIEYNAHRSKERIELWPRAARTKHNKLMDMLGVSRREGW
jgi:hypothetical protein